jgi:hypothetical protein
MDGGPLIHHSSFIIQHFQTPSPSSPRKKPAPELIRGGDPGSSPGGRGPGLHLTAPPPLSSPRKRGSRVAGGSGRNAARAFCRAHEGPGRTQPALAGGRWRSRGWELQCWMMDGEWWPSFSIHHSPFIIQHFQTSPPVIPAKAGIQGRPEYCNVECWMMDGEWRPSFSIHHSTFIIQHFQTSPPVIPANAGIQGPAPVAGTPLAPSAGPMKGPAGHSPPSRAGDGGRGGRNCNVG